MTRRTVFRGPHELAAVWRELAEEHGVRVADEVLAHDLELTPQSVAYRRQKDAWHGIDWTRAVKAHREAKRAEKATPRRPESACQLMEFREDGCVKEIWRVPNADTDAFVAWARWRYGAGYDARIRVVDHDAKHKEVVIVRLPSAD